VLLRHRWDGASIGCFCCTRGGNGGQENGCGWCRLQGTALVVDDRCGGGGGGAPQSSCPGNGEFRTTWGGGAVIAPPPPPWGAWGRGHFFLSPWHPPPPLFLADTQTIAEQLFFASLSLPSHAHKQMKGLVLLASNWSSGRGRRVLGPGDAAGGGTSAQDGPRAWDSSGMDNTAQEN
jgi:hypothetical protein